jgi:hypothetical protein
MKISILREFRKNHFSYSRTLVKDVVEFLPYFPHFVTSVAKIRYCSSPYNEGAEVTVEVLICMYF